MKLIIAMFILMMTWVPTCDTDGSGGSYSPTGPDDGTQYRDTSPDDVHGYVKDAVSRDPIVGASLCLSGTTQCSETSSKGYFSLTPNKTGYYRLVTTHPGYEPDSTSIIIRATYGIRQDIFLSPSGQ